MDEVLKRRDYLLEELDNLPVGTKMDAWVVNDYSPYDLYEDTFVKVDDFFPWRSEKQSNYYCNSDLLLTRKEATDIYVKRLYKNIINWGMLIAKAQKELEDEENATYR